MLPLNDAGGGGEDAERSLAETRVSGLAGLEENTKQLGPLVACGFPKYQIVRTEQAFEKISRTKGKISTCWTCVPLSVYWRATSATASPIFLRTSVTDSVVRQVTSFSRIAIRCSLGRLRKISLTSPEMGSLRVLVEILRKSTAEKARVCWEKVSSQHKLHRVSFEGFWL